MISRIYCNRHCYKFSDFDEVRSQLENVDSYLKQNIRGKSIIDLEEKRYYELKLELRWIAKESADVKKLSRQEREYVKSHEDSFERGKLMMRLIELWTGKDSVAQGRIIGQTPKGGDWRKRLAEEEDHMLKILKQMTDGDVTWTINALRTLQYVANKFIDMAFDEQELRDRKNKLEGI